MLDAYSIGHLVGRLLVSLVLVYLVIFVFSKGNLQVAWRRMKTFRSALAIGIVLILPLMANIGASMS